MNDPHAFPTTTGSVSEHRIECGPSDLCEPRDLALRQAGVEGLWDQRLDGVALCLGLAARCGACFAMSDEVGADVFGTHACIVLDRPQGVKYYAPMTTTELLSYTNSDAQADAVLRVAAVAEMDLGVATDVVAFCWDKGYVVLRSHTYTTVVLADGAITVEVPA